MSYERLAQWLGRRVDASSLGLFRVLWGLLMLWESLRKLPKAGGVYSPEFFHFKYALFPFVEPLPQEWMVSLEIGVMAVCAAAIALGLLFRPAALLFALIYSHLFLVEKLYYNNHFYLTILLTLLLALCEADRCYSLRSWRERGRTTPTVPFWNLVLLRGQMVIPYFYGGISKLNEDWLAGEPVRFWFTHKDVPPPVGWFVGQEWFVWFVSYGGLVLDLSAGFLLLHRRTFWPAAAALVVFHLTNDQLFKIGLFPYIGIAALVLFMGPDWPRRFFRGLAARLQWLRLPPLAPPARVGGRASTAAVALVAGWLGFQALWPLRIHFYGDDPSWTEVGHCFSWRMMLRTKDAWVQFVFDPPQAEALLEQTEELPRIGLAHLERMVKTPHFLLQYAHELDRTLERLGMPDVEIRVLTAVSLNGRPYQAMIDPTVDLTEASYGFFEVPSWIVPLEKHRRAGLYPRTEAERARRINDALEAAGAPRAFAIGRPGAVASGRR